ncbi:MAG TPA: hypothetical protein VNO70_12670 [Blastocatellia bacterium]|nr:hypothetical protein [Blastocatellia bacterium]
MERETFTRAEAREKVGRAIRTLAEFSGVPKGTTGKVVAADEADRGYDVAAEWNLAERRFGTALRPLRDWTRL